MPVTINPPRPQVTLLSKGSQDDRRLLPLRPFTSAAPTICPSPRAWSSSSKRSSRRRFPRNEDVEVAAADDSFHTMLSLSDGSLILEDARTAIGTVDPLARFGMSAFGPLHARVISAEGVAGDWIPLGTLVRVPAFKDLRCPRSTLKPCSLSGTNFFLIDSIASAQDFGNATVVPADFTGSQLAVPHPVAGELYIKLRDDPSTVQTLDLPITLMPASFAQANTPVAPPQPPESPQAASDKANSATPTADSAPTDKPGVAGKAEGPTPDTSPAPATPAKPSPPPPDSIPKPN